MRGGCGRLSAPVVGMPARRPLRSSEGTWVSQQRGPTPLPGARVRRGSERGSPEVTGSCGWRHALSAGSPGGTGPTQRARPPPGCRCRETGRLVPNSGVLGCPFSRPVWAGTRGRRTSHIPETPVGPLARGSEGGHPWARGRPAAPGSTSEQGSCCMNPCEAGRAPQGRWYPRLFSRPGPHLSRDCEPRTRRVRLPGRVPGVWRTQPSGCSAF